MSVTGAPAVRRSPRGRAGRSAPGRRPAGLAARLLAAAALLVPATAATAQAQPAPGAWHDTTIGVSAAAAGVWDDETHLGRGLALAVDASRPLGGHLRAGVEAGWFGHDRDSGYLAADGKVLHLMGRASLLVGPREWRTRPFVGGGLGVARSTGRFTARDPLALPVERRTSWTLTRLAWEVHLGIRGAAGARWAIRPEVRAGVIGGTERTTALETPLLRLQGGVAVEWAPR